MQDSKAGMTLPGHLLLDSGTTPTLNSLKLLRKSPVEGFGPPAHTTQAHDPFRVAIAKAASRQSGFLCVCQEAELTGRTECKGTK